MKKQYIIIFALIILLSTIVTAVQINKGIQTMTNIRFIKQSGFEKYLLYNYQFDKTGTTLTIDADINQSVYTFIKTTKNEWYSYSPQEKLDKCTIAQAYIIDDYPAFDCYNQAHRTQLIDTITTQIETGWKVLHKEQFNQYIQLNKSHITITILNIENRDRIQIGNNTVILEVQDLTLGVFNNTVYNSTNLSVHLNLSLNSNGTYIGAVRNFSNIPMAEGDTINVSSNVTIPTNTNINVMTRTWDSLNFTADLRVFMPMIEAGQTPIDRSGNFFENTCNPDPGDIYLGFDSNNQFPASIHDGAHDWWSCTHDDMNVSVGQNLTICAIVSYINRTGTQQHVIYNPSLYEFYLETNGVVVLKWQGNTGRSSSPEVLNNTPIHICGTFNNTNNDIEIFVGGSAVASTGSSNDNTAKNSTRFNIGTRDNGDDRDWNGTISFLRIWHDKLTPVDIKNVYETDFLVSNYSSSCDLSTNSTGCLYTRTNNFTQPKFNFLTEDLLVTPNLFNYTYTIQNVTAAAGDTCTYSGSGNWNINSADKCNTTAPVNVSGIINVYGSDGYWNCSTQVNCTNINNTNPDGLIWGNKDCHIKGIVL